MKLMILGLIAGLGLSAEAADQQRTKVLVDVTHNISVEIKEGDVRCSDKGYGNIQLKMSVPDLKFISPFDHTNEGELLPCMTAGRCQPGNMPEDLIGGNPGIEQTSLHRTVTEIVYFNSAAGNCERDIKENVEMTVRGKKFAHERYLFLGKQAIALCETL